MKKTFIIFITTIFFALISFTSCATAIKTAKNIETYKMQSNLAEPQMEFIGYKTDASILSTSSTTRTIGRDTITIMSPFDQCKAILATPPMRKMGQTLQEKNIALDKTYAYFGIYSLQELEIYKSSKRYVTFIEVIQNEYTYTDNLYTQKWLGPFGSSMIGLGATFFTIGALIPEKQFEGTSSEVDNNNSKTTLMVMGGITLGAGLVSAVIALLPTKTKMTFNGAYNVYVYDTIEKAVVRKDVVSVNSEDEFDGSYEYDDASKKIVHEYYAKVISNAFLKKYDELNSWMISQK